ncbi:hypothetical protein C8P63_10437 [Melghirimyces profundicolus]|uniref:Uncharacterized protein n=1 Tax=Melghirimyces profundicolus TaxID=1242148 RepID=A0A2T6C4I3_9BACL|nr:hypothetical protein C8P63_10437 [Melghirimyces profundicolus]
MGGTITCRTYPQENPSTGKQVSTSIDLRFKGFSILLLIYSGSVYVSRSRIRCLYNDRYFLWKNRTRCT